MHAFHYPIKKNIFKQLSICRRAFLIYSPLFNDSEWFCYRFLPHAMLSSDVKKKKTFYYFYNKTFYSYWLVVEYDDWGGLSNSFKVHHLGFLMDLLNQNLWEKKVSKRAYNNSCRKTCESMTKERRKGIISAWKHKYHEL